MPPLDFVLPPALKLTAENPPVNSIMEFRLSQVFSRRSLSYLWDKRAELDAGQVSIINSIYLNKKKGGAVGSQEITYKLSRSGAGKLGYGRLYGSKGAFETLEKECRGTICKDYYHDIDMVNCHPVLLVQFARKKYPNQPDILSEVQRYNENREAYLAEVMSENSISRDEAKQGVIKVLYGGIVSKESYLYPLMEQVRSFSTLVFKTDSEYDSLTKALKSEKNIYGSFLSYILQTIERECMLALKTFLEQQKWSVDVLCYDGVMIRKRDDAIVTSDLLADCSAFIHKQTDYSVELISKEFSYYDMPPITEEVSKGVSLAEYQNMRDEVENNYFYHEPTHQYVKVNERAGLQFMVDSHARAVINHYFYFKHSDRFADYTGFFDIWNKDPKKRICDEVSFRPSTNPRVFQLPINFIFWKASPPTEPTGALPLFLEIVNLMSNNNPTLYNYILDWTAHLLQHPTDLPGVALVLTGSKGVGKDTFGDFLQDYVVGQHFSTNYNTNRQFFSTHDMGKINKFLIKMEETNKKDCFENASELKSAITATKITANPKGVKEITCDNFARYIFTTNKPNPVDMSDRERRFVLCPVSDKRRGDYEFWTKVRTNMFSPGGGYEVGMFLMERDLQNFNIRRVPENEYQNTIVASEESSETKWFNQWDGKKLSATEAYADYCNYCRDNNLKYAQDASWFAKSLQIFVRDNKIINSRPGNTSFYEKYIQTAS